MSQNRFPSIDANNSAVNDKVPVYPENYATYVVGRNCKNRWVKPNIASTQSRCLNILEVGGCGQNNATTAKITDITSPQWKSDLRKDIQHLTRRQVTDHCQPFHKILCKDILENGYHYTFTEIFQLQQNDLELRRRHISQGEIPMAPPLGDQLESLNILREKLIIAETARRNEDDHTMFVAYFELATYFKNCCEMSWIYERYVKYMKVASERIEDDKGYKKAIALYNFGMLRMSKKQYEGAIEDFTKLYKICVNKNWLQWRSDDNLEFETVIRLMEAYFGKAESLDKQHITDRVRYSILGHKTALLSRDYAVQAEASRKVGLILEESGEFDDALQFYQSYFDLALEAKDTVHLGNACVAIARYYRWKKLSYEAIKYLHKYAQLCDSGQDWISLSKACQLLSRAYDDEADYKNSLKWIKKSYEMPDMFSHIKEKFYETNKFTKIFLGIATGHSMHDKLIDALVLKSDETTLNIINWRNDPTNPENSLEKKVLKRPEWIIRERWPKRNVQKYAANPALSFVDDELHK